MHRRKNSKMKKWIYIVVIVVITIVATLTIGSLYSKKQQAEEFQKFDDYLQDDYYDLIVECYDLFQAAADANEDIELSEWAISEDGDMDSLKLQSRLYDIKEKIINKDLKYEDSLRLKKYALNIIEGSLKSTRLISAYAYEEDDYETSEEFDDIFSNSLDSTNKQLDKQNALLDKYR